MALLIHLFSPLDIVGSFSVIADYKEYYAGHRFEFDALTVDSVGSHFIIEMQSYFDKHISIRMNVYAYLVSLGIVGNRCIALGEKKNFKSLEEEADWSDKLYSNLEKDRVVAIVFLKRIPPPLKEIGVGSREDPRYNFTKREEGNPQKGILPSDSIVTVVDVNADKGDDLRASVLRDLKECDPKKVENELIRRILEYFKGTVEGDHKMGESYYAIKDAGRIEEKESIFSALSNLETIEAVDKETGYPREQLTKMYINLGRMLQNS